MRISADKILRLKTGSALVVIAHPDDETIWMSGTILMNPQVKWTIFSLCRGNDSDRAPKFRKVCKYYGAREIISDLEDEGVMNIRESVPEIKKKIKRLLPVRSYDYVFTHGVDGEYGHPRHKGTHQVVKLLVESCKLKTKRFFVFSYELDERKGVAVPVIVKSEIRNPRLRQGFDGQAKFETNSNVQNSKSKNIFVSKLAKDIFRRKLEVVENMYGFRKNSFEYRSCARVEAFRLLRSKNSVR